MFYRPNPIEDRDTIAAAHYRLAVETRNLWIETGIPRWLERLLVVVLRLIIR